MDWLYHLLWPLFQLCSDSQALALSGSSPLQVASSNDGPVYQFPAFAWSLSVCPTPLMHVVLLLSVLGVLTGLAIVISGLVRVSRAIFSSAEEPGLGHLVEDTYQELEDASWAYLWRNRR